MAWWLRRSRTIAVEDVATILAQALELVKAGAEIRVPTYPTNSEDETLPLNLTDEDAAFITTGGSEPQYDAEDEDEEEAAPNS